MPANPAIFRTLALGFPNTVESAHMGHPDFRVVCADGKLRIFCTLSGEATSRGVLKLTLEQQASFREELPQVFAPCEGGWGRMGMTYVHLDKVEQDTLRGALSTAYRNVTSKVEAAKPRRASAGGITRAATTAESGPKPFAKKMRAQPRIKS